MLWLSFIYTRVGVSWHGQHVDHLSLRSFEVPRYDLYDDGKMWIWLVSTTSSNQSRVSVTCTLGMFIPVTVGTIVPLLCVMTTGGIGNCTSYKNDCEKLFVAECISTGSISTVAFSQEHYVVTSSMSNLAPIVHHK
jgi:hypothetical protein